jgi:energy-coupling factor transporter transmembrane protein EcfT
METPSDPHGSFAGRPFFIDVDSIRDRGRLSWLDVFDPRCRVLCALVFTGALALTQSLPGLLAGSVVPCLLIFAKDSRDTTKALIHTLIRVNAVTVFVWLVLPLTAPGGWAEGLRLAFFVTCKLNAASVTLIRMIAELGMERIDGVLIYFRVPEKMRVLLLLTARYVFLLQDRLSAMTRAIRLRAPELRGKRLYAAFACMLGTTLIHSSDKAERSMLALRCRGGMGGFSQYRPLDWRWHDTSLCAFFAANAIVVCLCA